MTSTSLRGKVKEYISFHGSNTKFIAEQSGISRPNFSKWLNGNDLFGERGLTKIQGFLVAKGVK